MNRMKLSFLIPLFLSLIFLFLLFPQGRNFVIDFGEKLAGRGLTHEVWNQRFYEISAFGLFGVILFGIAFLFGTKKYELVRKNEQIVFLGFWAFVLLFLFFQQSFVFMHYDDFGYGSLSYKWTENSHGMNWNFSDLISFLKWHYLYWGGRVLFYGLNTVLLKFGEPFVQFVQSLFIFVVLVFSYRIVKAKDFDIGASVLTFALFGSLGRTIAKDGLFWYAASSGYVWPFAFLLALISCEKFWTKNLLSLMAFSMIALVASFSHEQISVLIIIYTISSIVIDSKVKKDFEFRKFPVYVSLFIGSLLQIFAPGNFFRDGMDTVHAGNGSISFFEKLSERLPLIIEYNIGLKNVFFSIVLIISFSMLFLCFSRKVEGKMKLFVRIFSCIGVFSVFIGFISSSILVNAGRVIFVVLFSVFLFDFCINLKKYVILSLFLGGLASQGMLIFSPVLPERTALVFQIVMHIVVVFIMVSYFSMNSETTEKKSYLFLLAFISAICFSNMAFVTGGYVKTGYVNELNRFKLREFSNRIKKGEAVKRIQLYKLPDDRFTVHMPYFKNPSAISFWMKNYFELPQSVEFIWEDYSTEKKN